MFNAIMPKKCLRRHCDMLLNSRMAQIINAMRLAQYRQNTSSLNLGGADLPDKLSFKKRLERMKSASKEITYFVITLTVSEDGMLAWSTQTSFAGFTKASPRRELRTACSVNGHKMLSLWQNINELGLAVDSSEDLVIFLHLGGNAIIEESLAQKYFSFIFEKYEFVHTGFLTKSQVEEINPSNLKRAPTPKLRMKILERDKYRCRICGRRPDDYTDLELHVHHFIPWALGGLTEENNLMTLCHTCHNGLDPHFEMSLVEVFPETSQSFHAFISNIESESKNYLEGVKRYRQKVKEILSYRDSD